MNRPKDRAGSYLRGSPDTFEGEVEFLEQAAHYANRRGWSTYVRWSIYLVASVFGVGLVVATVSAVL